nr:venom protein [Lampona murina]
MKTSFAFVLVFVTLILVPMISRAEEIEEAPEEARDCQPANAVCNYWKCCPGLSCKCTSGGPRNPGGLCICK